MKKLLIVRHALPTFASWSAAFHRRYITKITSTVQLYLLHYLKYYASTRSLVPRLLITSYMIHRPCNIVTGPARRNTLN